LKIPVLALVDSDPYGLKILSVYSSGSKQMSYDSSHLTTSDIKWLGVSKFEVKIDAGTLVQNFM
jgi:meiotic recombination protein SPO11